MKNLRILVMCLSFALIGSVAFTACGHSHDHSEEQGKEYTSAYICPMHCDGSGSEEMGKCPVCGMDYVKNEDAKEEHNGHSHDDHSHDDGHTH
jgi:hypothetical protein